MNNLYDFTVTTIDGESIKLEIYKGKVLLIVNTASKCGFTPQLEGLEKLHKEFYEQGLVILGFPCNQFGKQEPGQNEEILEFCQLNYGVSFIMHEKTDVNGKNTHPLYQYLKRKAPGILGTEKIKWNFTKFLVGRDGEVSSRFSPKTKPHLLTEPIKEALKC